MSIPGITPEERSLIKSYLLLLYIHKVFERDCRIIQESGIFKSPQLYVELVGSSAKRAAIMLREIKRELMAHTVKVLEIRPRDTGIEARFACRGYIGSMDILWPSFREEMMLRMRAYLGLESSDEPPTQTGEHAAAASTASSP